MKENRRPHAMLVHRWGNSRKRASAPQKLEQSGAMFFAMQNFRRVVAAFTGLGDVSELQSKADALARNPHCEN